MSLTPRPFYDSTATSENKKSFFTRASKLFGNRFDPFYHKTEFEKFEEALVNGRYKVEILKWLIFKVETGKGIYQFDDVGFDYLNVNNIRKWEVDFSQTEKVNRDISNFSNVVQKGEILTGRVGTIGNFALYSKEDRSLFSDSLIKIVTKEEIDVTYLTCVLNSKLVFSQLKKNSKGSVQEVINTRTINKLKIPLPPLEIQEEIAAHIQSIRERAKELERDARREVERAKREVEQMILGEV